MLYFAYGSNLNIDQMARRCPDAIPVAPYSLMGARLVFRGVADLLFEPDAVCPGGLWRITPRCERALDRYEGFNPDGGGMYRKLHVELDDLPDGEERLMMYVMNSTGIMPPAAYYFNTIADGYADFDLDARSLRMALKHAHDAMHLTHVERKRVRRNGRPQVKPRPVPKAKPLPQKRRRKREVVDVGLALDVFVRAGAKPEKPVAKPVASRLGDWRAARRAEGRRV